tara:strand:+ start:327 stop:593 length:267 start_codon:yes stop_codon:yes gene_type:complete
MNVYTEEDVAEHNTRHDCWIIIQGRVYDLSSWITKHPGGVAVILPFAGRDATKRFENAHDWAMSPAWEQKENLCIGKLASSENRRERN